MATTKKLEPKEEKVEKVETQEEKLAGLIADVEKLKADLETEKTKLANSVVNTDKAKKEADEKAEVFIQRKLKATKEVLDKQPKVMTMIPLGFNEKPGAVETVTVNGYRYDIKKGVYVKVPETVANIIRDAYNQTMEVNERFSVNRDEETSKALS